MLYRSLLSIALLFFSFTTLLAQAAPKGFDKSSALLIEELTKKEKELRTLKPGSKAHLDLNEDIERISGLTLITLQAEEIDLVEEYNFSIKKLGRNYTVESWYLEKRVENLKLQAQFAEAAAKNQREYLKILETYSEPLKTIEDTRKQNTPHYERLQQSSKEYRSSAKKFGIAAGAVLMPGIYSVLIHRLPNGLGNLSAAVALLTGVAAVDYYMDSIQAKINAKPYSPEALPAELKKKESEIEIYKKSQIAFWEGYFRTTANQIVADIPQQILHLDSVKQFALSNINEIKVTLNRMNCNATLLDNKTKETLN